MSNRKATSALAYLRNLFLLATRYGAHADRPVSTCPRPGTVVSKHRYGSDDLNIQGLQILSLDQQLHRHDEHVSNMRNGIDRKVQKPEVFQPKHYGFSWTKWILGAMLSYMFLPFVKDKWKKVLRLEGEVEMAVEVVENVAESIERVAVIAEKLSREVAEKIPGDGKVKEAAMLIERVSEEVERDAQLTEDIIHKVEELKQEVETLIEPIINKKGNSAEVHYQQDSKN